MARFFTQLRFLLWKNYLLRKRQKALLLTEIVWPLILFSILTLVRTRDLTEDLTECHYDNKAMPSTGFLPFVQSLLCTLTNKCNPHATTGDKSGYAGDRNKQGVRGLVTPLLTLLNSTSNAQDISALITDTIPLINEVSGLHKARRRPFDTKKMSDVLNVVKLNESLINCAMTPNSAQKFIEFDMQRDFFTLTAIAIFRYNDGFSNIQDQTKVWIEWKKYIFCDAEHLKRSFSGSSDPNDVTLVGKEICGDVDGVCLKNAIMSSLPLAFPLALINLVSDVLTNVTGYGLTTEIIPIFESLQVISKDMNSPGVKNLMITLAAMRNMTDTTNNTMMGIMTCGQLSTNINDAFRESSKLEKIKDRFQNVGNEDEGDNDQRNSTIPGPTGDLDANTTSICSGFKFNATQANKCWNVLNGFGMPKKMQLNFYTLMRGYIFVAPQTPIVHKVVLQLEDWLRSVDSIRRPILDIFNNAEHYQDAMNHSKVAKAYQIATNILSNMNDSFGADAPDMFNSPTVETFLGLKGFFVNSSDPEAFLVNAKSKIGSVAAMFDCMEIDRFIYVENEYKLEQAGVCLQDYYVYYSGLVFDADKDELETPLITYKIRMATDLVDNTFRIMDGLWTPRPRDRPFIDTKYLYYGFSFLQDSVDRALINALTNETHLAGLYAQQFPNPCYVLDVFQKALSGLFPFFMVLSWVFSFAIIVKNTVYEKELRLKEVMKVMGLGNGVHWVGWFLTSFAILFVSVCLLSLMLTFGRIIQYADPSVLIVLLTVYGIATITQAFLLSTFFSNANLAAATGGVIYFLIYLPYGFLRRNRWHLPEWAKVVSCLIPQIALGWSAAAVSDWEEEGSGVQWNNIDTSPVSYHHLTFQYCLQMMLLDIAMNIVLIWYIENIRPGKYGMPRKWYFPLQKSYWCGYNVSNLKETPVSDRLNTGPAKENLEEDPLNLPLGVCVRHLSKKYSNGVKAVSDLCINFYEGHITSFLGHNGAGKTTTLSMLTGLFPPTSGTAYIGGRDIRTDFDQIRHSLGMCPQYNVLFESLTVEEQLKFYAGLKGVDDKNLDKEVAQGLKDVGLTKKKHAQAQDLSGGMKRKLSVAVAFIGGSRTVILDEPTAGVDPFARRGIWDMLIKLKKGRTVILSTHHMDEADLLGDRIAIISQGHLTCCGSSLFLKRRFGSGYRMTVVTKCASIAGSRNASQTFTPESVESVDTQTESEPTRTRTTESKGSVDQSETVGSAQASTSTFTRSTLPPISSSTTSANRLAPLEIVTKQASQRIEDFVRKRIERGYLVEKVGSELVFCLPCDDPKILMKFFEDLDNNLVQLDIITYGVSDTTLEEIFLKMVGVETDEQLNKEHSSCACCKFLRRKIGQVFAPKPRSVTPDSVNNNLMDSGAIAMKRKDEAETSPGDAAIATSAAHPVVEATQRSSFWLARRRLGALFNKRFINCTRNTKGAFAEIILPVLLILVTMMMNKLMMSDSVNQPPLILTPWLYSSEKNPNTIFFSLDNPSPGANAFGKEILKNLEEPPGIGIRCLKDQPYTEVTGECVPSDANWTLAHNYSYNVDNVCFCNQRSDYVCPIGSYVPLPSQVITNTTDILADVSNRNITQYLLMTEREYRKKRYGGFSLGELDVLAATYPNSTVLIQNFATIIHALELFAYNGSIKFEEYRVVQIPLVFNDNHSLTPAQHFSHFIMGLETKDNVKIWFNNQGWAALPAYTNVLSNAQLRAAVPPGEGSQWGIVTINHPMNYSNSKKADIVGVSLQPQKDTVVAVMVLLAFSVVPASFVLFIIDERINQAKHLQQVSGVSAMLYWISSFLWDICNFMVPVILCIIIFYIFEVEPLVGYFEGTCATFLLLMCYGFAIIPLMYSFTFFFRIPSLAFIILLVGNFLLGVVSTMTTITLETLGQSDQELMEINEICMQVFLIMPQYCLGRGVFDMILAYKFYEAERMIFDRGSVPDPFQWTILGQTFVCLMCQGLVGFFLVMCIENKHVWIRMCGRRLYVPRRRISVRVTSEDEDVAAERKFVARADPAEYALLVRELVKDYAHLRAVDHLSFCVPAGQCFGLLGVNGAGKTTTFKTLTGKMVPTKGEAFIDGYSCLNEQHRVNAALGYCPQFDALNARLTGRETIRFYARIRGIPENRVSEIVEWAINHMNLRMHADKTTETYSGGNKRKLSTAIALIGNPKLVLLDEPTTGMDPKARRFLWNRILDIVKDGRSVILTSHSMEECETLCGRMGIMVSGQMRCIGSVQHLKNKFGDGYTLTLKLASDSAVLTRDAGVFVEQQFPGSILKESHQGMLEYQLPVKGTTLSRIFAIVQSAKQRLGVDDYAVTQTTLDQVFIQFASEQVGGDVDLLAPDTGAVLNGFTNARQARKTTVSAERPAFDDMPLDDTSIKLTVHTPQSVEPVRGQPSPTDTQVRLLPSSSTENVHDADGEMRL